MTPRLVARFEAKVTKGDACWLWQARLDKKGYGRFSVGGRQGGMRLAHRVSWEFNRGEIPAGLCVLHKCDNPRCVNPDHLFLGTQLENIADCQGKGRDRRGEFPSQAGTANSQAKLTEAEVREIRGLRGKLSQRGIAKRFGVNQATIGKILTGKRWQEVKP